MPRFLRPRHTVGTKPSEQGVDEGRYHRSLGQHEQSAEHEHHDESRHQPVFFPHAKEGHKLDQDAITPATTTDAPCRIAAAVAFRGALHSSRGIPVATILLDLPCDQRLKTLAVKAGIIIADMIFICRQSRRS
jgi:hypothetical protein